MLWAPNRKDRWRYARLFVLAALLIAGGATAFHLTNQLKDHASSMTRYVRVDTWAVQQTEYALQQFRAAFARHVAGDDDITMATVRERLAEAKATVPLMRRGKNYEQFRLLVDIDGAAEMTTKALDTVDRVLDFVDELRGSMAVLHIIEETLTPPSQRLRQLSVDIAHVRAELQDGDLANVRWLTDVNRGMLIAFVGVAFVFIAALISEIVAAKKAERIATENERRTRYVAEHDLLTGLPNRVAFQDMLQGTVDEAREAEKGFALHVVNFDGFKDINDSFGEAFGDSLLVAASKRLGDVIGKADLLVRLGGDEFAVIQNETADAADWHDFAKRLLATCGRPFKLDGREVHISVSIGVAVFPGDGETGEDLLKSASMALSAAKREGHCYTPFEPAMALMLENRKKLETELRRAIAGEGLEVFFQPQVQLRGRRFFGAEALARWHHAELGWVSPGTFIPIAEESGLILPLGRWMLESACRAALNWPGPADSVVAVNVSPSQFIHQDLVKEVQDVLAGTGLPPHRLELEITEGILMRDERAAIVTLSRLHELGVQLAIDDFGTGYSSLSYLKRFDVHKLKIDQSFVKELEEDMDDQRIVTAVVELASSLGMTTIAEGIETAEQSKILADLGCQEGQGYFFAKPMPDADFRAWVRDWQTAGRRPDTLGVAASG